MLIETYFALSYHLKKLDKRYNIVVLTENRIIEDKNYIVFSLMTEKDMPVA